MGFQHAVYSKPHLTGERDTLVFGAPQTPRKAKARWLAANWALASVAMLCVGLMVTWASTQAAAYWDRPSPLFYLTVFGIAAALPCLYLLVVTCQIAYPWQVFHGKTKSRRTTLPLLADVDTDDSDLYLQFSRVLSTTFQQKRPYGLQGAWATAGYPLLLSDAEHAALHRLLDLRDFIDQASREGYLRADETSDAVMDRLKALRPDVEMIEAALDGKGAHARHLARSVLSETTT